jgi:glycine cleavage system H protein
MGKRTTLIQNSTFIVMDGFSYVNIFETKGIEYIVIIIFLLLLIPFSMILNKKEEIKTGFRRMRKQLSDKIRNIPYGLYYSQNHTWTYLEKSGNAKIGLDELLLHITGYVKINYLKKTGDLISKGDLIAEIEQEGRKLKVFSPVSGKISDQNSLLVEYPDIINEDPYRQGWLYSIRPSDWKSETFQYYMADEAKQWLMQESGRVRDFLAIKSGMYSSGLHPVTLQDGGEISENILGDMPAELWNDFQQEFLDPV